MKFSKAVVKYRVIILVIALAAMIPSLFGYINTRVNYDMLNYLPGDMETIVGQIFQFPDQVLTLLLRHTAGE